MFGEFGINAGYVEDLHARYLQNPQAVPEVWRAFFESRRGDGAPMPAPTGASSVGNGQGAAGHGNGTATHGANGNGAASHGANGNGTNGNGVAPFAYLASGAPPPLPNEHLFAAAEQQGRVFQLVNAYRVRGHLFAHLDPLGNPPPTKPELELGNFGFTAEDLDRVFPTMGLSGLGDRATLREIIGHLQAIYCGSVGVEFTHIEDPDQRNWLLEKLESLGSRGALDAAEPVRILTKLTDAELFEQFIHKKFVGAKRFSLEGAESMIPMLDLLIDSAAAHGVQEVVMGMAHRGRLNVLVNILGKNARDLFAAFQDKTPERFLGSGDVKYHLGYSSDRLTPSGSSIHLSLCFNPSHLEIVNPVVEGRARAKQDRAKRHGVMPLLIHGDAAFMGQGVVPETLNLAGLTGYTTGGTIHLVVNNQVGFTTNPVDSRSTRYCTDITRMMRVPVFHVNGEDPEAVIQVARLAIEFRQRYAMDVVIDMYCYRKYGHNEGDEPRFTQPLMYSRIDKKPSVREMYVQRLVQGGLITKDRADRISEERHAVLEAALEEATKGDFNKGPDAMQGIWSKYLGGPDKAVPEVATAVEKAKLLALAERLAVLPDGFKPHKKVGEVLQGRREKTLAGKPFDWGTAEHLAFASLLAEGKGIRLSGQDARRGTFTHRHAVVFDTETGSPYCPLAQIGRFEVYDSSLSEAGVLGFEYGYSLDCPEGLVLWEAQFGDFANGAQVIIDQFLVSAEDKWKRLSGLVLLLPHGFEGQGPEHSSARVERFLQLAAEDNIQVQNLTTPAQLFHSLRRQVHRPWRKPLVIFTPKSLLRAPFATSTVDELATGTFQRVLTDNEADPKKVRKVLLCSGKVYYDLVAARKERKRDDVAILRVEQLYPFSDALPKALAAYKKGTPVVWVQEEPRNNGSWYFVNAQAKEMFGGEVPPLSVVARAESASPATGSLGAHNMEQKMLVAEAFEG